MHYFDSYAFIGKRPVEDTEELWSHEHVVTLMNRCGIHAALVYHTLAKEYDPNVGNQYLTEIIQNEPRFFACYVALPHHTGEMPEPKKWLDSLPADQPFAVKIFPKIYCFEMNPQTLDPLLKRLEQEEIPLLLDMPDIDFNILAGLCERYPRLSLLVQKLYWDQSRQMIPLFEKYKNLFIEFSSYQGFCMPDWFVKNFGAERLLFGSEMPLKTPGAARALIDYADISKEDKQMIASGNLMRLLKVEALPEVTFQPQDKFIETAWQGAPIEHIHLIDAHSHSGHENFMGASRIFMPHSNPAQELAKFDRLGVNQICISSWLGIWQDSVLGNLEMEQNIRQFPDRYIPYVTIDPNFMSESEIAAAIQKYHVELKYPGLKPYFPRGQYPLTGKKFEAWFRFGNAHQLFALIHYDEDTTFDDIDQLAPRYPDLAFLVAHTGCSYRAARKVIELVKKYSNVLAEITFTAVLSNVIEILCREIGAEKVLFGTDTPMRDPAPQLGWIVYADISPAEKKLILGENMNKILERAREGLVDGGKSNSNSNI